MARLWTHLLLILACSDVAQCTTTTTASTTTVSSTTSTISPSSTSSIASSTSSTSSPTSTTSNSSSVSTISAMSPTTSTNGSTVPTTSNQLTACRNGSCYGNDTSCIEDIVETCELEDPILCYQTIQTNGTELTYYEVGCSSTCEYLEEVADDITRITRCCDTPMCTDELLTDNLRSGSSGVHCSSLKTLITVFTSVIASSMIYKNVLGSFISHL